jgi:hypothetical protein
VVVVVVVVVVMVVVVVFSKRSVLAKGVVGGGLSLANLGIGTT